MQFFKPVTGRLALISFAMVLSAVLCVSSASASLIVIANNGFKENRVSSSDLSDLYLGKTSQLGSQTITPMDLPNHGKVYQEFYTNVIGMNVNQVNNYWSQLIFSGQASQPQTIGDANSAIHYVEQNPGAIAYLDTSSLQNLSVLKNVKIVYGHVDPRSIQAHSPATASGNPLGGKLPKPFSDRLPLPQHTLLDLQRRGHSAQVSLAQPNITDYVPSNLWQSMVSHFALQKYYDYPAVVKKRNWYLHHRGELNNVLHNAIPYISYIYGQTVKQDIPAEFSLLPMLESGYNPFAHSRVGAVGLWQMMPQTATLYGLHINWWYDNRRDILISSNAALRYIHDLHKQFGSWLLTAASYDSGSGAVMRSMQRNRLEKLPADYWSLSLPVETQNYVPKLLALASIIEQANQYQVTLPQLGLHPFFTSVKITSQMDLAEISRLSGISQNLIQYLNPGLRRYASSNEGSYTLLLPTAVVGRFAHHLNALKGKKHISWQYHEVYHGETLKSIASNYHTSLTLLERANRLSKPVVAEGQGILVPIRLNATYTKVAAVGDNQQIAVASRKTTSVTANTITASQILSGQLAISPANPGKEQESSYQPLTDAASDNIQPSSKNAGILHRLTKLLTVAAVLLH